MPDVDDQHRHPGVRGIGGVVVVDAQHVVQRVTQQADITAAEDLPDRADHVPRDQQWNGHHDQAQRRPAALGRHGQGNRDTQRDLDQQYTARINELTQQRVVQTRVLQDLPEPVGADEIATGLVEDVLHRIVDHGHHRDNRAECHQQKHRHHQPPGLVVLNLTHGTPHWQGRLRAGNHLHRASAIAPES